MALLIRDVPKIHPDTVNKWYALALDNTEHAGASVISASWSAATGITVEDSAYTNPGDAGHPAGYDGPVLAVALSTTTGTATGSAVDITVSYQTDRTEGPLHHVLRVTVSSEGA